jgi:tetratricopeptide (TPR) repeat protein
MDYLEYSEKNRPSKFTRWLRRTFTFIPSLKRGYIQDNISDLNKELREAKLEHDHDKYRDIVIKIISFYRAHHYYLDTKALFYNTAIYFKKNHRYDLSVIFYKQLIEEFKQDNLDADAAIMLGDIHIELADVFIEMENYYDATDNLVRAKHYNIKYHTHHFKLVCIIILRGKFLDAIFLLENLIFENNKYLNKTKIDYYIVLSILCYLCIIEFGRNYYIQMLNIRGKLEEYKRAYIDFCETPEYLFLLNVISCIENKDLEHFGFEIHKFSMRDDYNELHPVYNTIFIQIRKNIETMISGSGEPTEYL